MNKIIIALVSLVLPGLSLAHEGHLIEGMLGHTVHGFSIVEIMSAVCAVAVWLATNKQSKATRIGGLLVSAAFLGAGMAI